jgi:hypothetical protein
MVECILTHYQLDIHKRKILTQANELVPKVISKYEIKF